MRYKGKYRPTYVLGHCSLLHQYIINQLTSARPRDIHLGSPRLRPPHPPQPPTLRLHVPRAPPQHPTHRTANDHGPRASGHRAIRLLRAAERPGSEPRPRKLAVIARLHLRAELQHAQRCIIDLRGQDTGGDDAGGGCERD